MKKSAIVALVLTLGCANTMSTQQTPPATAAPAAQSQFKNLQVFPKDIPREQLIAAMRSFTRSLGVRCNHCHVVTATEPEEKLDFPADTKEEKRVARVMLRMVQQINGEWMVRVEQAEGHTEAEARAEATAEPRVSCWTCHRGKPEPESPPPPPPAPAR